MVSKLFVSDYDHTFSCEDSIQENIQSVQKWKNASNLFVFATGRTCISFQRVVKQYQLSYDYVILNHGAVVQRQDGTILQFTPILRDSFNRLVIYLKSFPYAINIRYVTPYQEDASFIDDSIVEVLLEFDNAIDGESIYTKLYSCFRSLFHIYLFSNCIEIVSIHVDKSMAIEFLSTLLSCKSVFVIGDNYNDLSMIRTFHGCCVENAVEEVKRISKKVYADVSSYIEDLLQLE